MKVERISGKEYNVQAINSIKYKYPDLRQASKPITFCLTYAGTWRALANDTGMSEFDAKNVEKKYHELYKQSDAYVAKHIEQAKKDGYVIGAFGLKIRTPLLKSTVTEGIHAMREVGSEMRTAGNALGQSWCLLNCRSCNEVMSKVWNSKYKLDILPCIQIHDALYFYIKDDLEVLTWFNKVLTDAMAWQDDPIIAHDLIKLGGDLEVFYPDWSHGIELPNTATKEEIVEILKNEKSNK